MQFTASALFTLAMTGAAIAAPAESMNAKRFFCPEAARFGDFGVSPT